MGQVLGVTAFATDAFNQQFLVVDLDEFDATVLGTTLLCVVTGERSRRPGALIVNVLASDTGIRQDLAHGTSALLGQFLVEFSRTGSIGVANDQNLLERLRGLLGGWLLVGQCCGQARQFPPAFSGQLCGTNSKHFG